MAFGSKKNKDKAQTADSQEVQDTSKVRANRAVQKRRAGKMGPRLQPGGDLSFFCRGKSVIESLLFYVIPTECTGSSVCNGYSWLVISSDVIRLF